MLCVFGRCSDPNHCARNRVCVCVCLQLSVPDDTETILLKANFHTIADFMHAAVADEGRVYVHCKRGISRVCANVCVGCFWACLCARSGRRRADLRRCLHYTHTPYNSTPLAVFHGRDGVPHQVRRDGLCGGARHASGAPVLRTAKLGECRCACCCLRVSLPGLHVHLTCGMPTCVQWFEGQLRSFANEVRVACAHSEHAPHWCVHGPGASMMRSRCVNSCARDIHCVSLIRACFAWLCLCLADGGQSQAAGGAQWRVSWVPGAQGFQGEAEGR